MRKQAKFICPRCEFPLIPVHAVESGHRRVIALTCPEPYCDHMQIVPPKLAREIERNLPGRVASYRQAN